MKRVAGWGAWTLVALGLASCSEPTAVRNAAPPIRQVISEPSPAPNDLSVAPTAPIANNDKAAIENYRQVLALGPDPETRREALRRIADLEVSEHDRDPRGADKQLQEAISIYRQLLADRPQDASNDGVLYQLARAYQSGGDDEDALKALQALSRHYPGSSLMSDAHFRAGQILYNAGKYNEAGEEYRVVMDLGAGNQFFEQSQYKYGWALYKQGKYDAALTVFFKLLDTELPPGEVEDPQLALGKVSTTKLDMAKSVLHVVSLSFFEMGGGSAINEYFKAHGQPRFYMLIYNALGEQYLAKQRYSDAAKTFTAFIELHPDNPNAPQFQRRVIAAYEKAGFTDQVVAEKERFASTYSPEAGYWAGKPASPEVMKDLRADMEDLGRFYHARAQKGKDPAQQRQDLAKAATWYAKILQVFPNDPHAPDINMLYADSLYDAGQTETAAKQYDKTAYGYPTNPKSADAAFASVQAWQRLGHEVPAEKRPEVLRQSVAASAHLATAFPTHPQRNVVLTQSAVDLYEVKDLDAAANTATQVLQASTPATPEQRRLSWGVVADARFAQKRWADSEAAYSQTLALTPPSDPKRRQISDQLAASVYHQAEAARTAGNQGEAARLFLRVGQLTPDASIRPQADYDASAALLANKDWAGAETLLETMRTRDPHGKFAADIDKKLAYAYESDNKPGQAAGAFARIARAQGGDTEARRAAAWTSASLYDKANDRSNAAAAYLYYIGTFAQPLDPAMDARKRLADYSHDDGNTAQYQARLRDIIAADAAAGGARSPKSRVYAAHASLTLAQDVAARASAISLSQPLKVSLVKRKQAVLDAIAKLKEANAYNVADVSTQATFDIGKVWQDFSTAIGNSERPSRMSAEVLEQYNLQMQELSEPIEENAVQAHEVNLQRVGQGLWDGWIEKSVDALAALNPGKYAKREKAEDTYDSLR